MKAQSRRIWLIRGIVFPLVLFVSLLSLALPGKESAAAAKLPFGQKTFVFPNNEAKDAQDLHIEWKKAVRIVSATPFTGIQGSGTGRTDLDGGTVAKGVGRAEIAVDFDGNKPPTVLNWYWTIKVNGKSVKLGDEKTGDPEAPKAPSAPVTTTFDSGDGLQTGTFTVPAGNIKVTLPADIRAGDTISGTVSVEPNGQTPEEKAKNRRELGNFMLMVPFRPVPPDPNAAAPPNILRSGNLTGIVVNPNGPSRVGAGFYIQDPVPDPGPDTSEGVFVFSPQPPSSPSGVMVGPVPPPKPATIPPAPLKFDLRLYQLPNQDSPLGPCARSGALVTINEGCKPISQLVFTPPYQPITVNETPTPPVTFTVPILGQNGRPVVITGPFDGNSSNTGVTCQPGSGEPIQVLAESPRKAVFIAPPNITGPAQVTVSDGDKQTTAPLRIVKLDLTAPKTNLVRGEKTTLTVSITGLQGITAPVPLTLSCTGVITMQGGTYQSLVIQPSQVGSDGSYTTTRDITGVQAGGWGATATVVTTRFNACMRDDSRPATVILWNTVSGDYFFTSTFPPLIPPVQPPQTGTTFTGTGKIAMKGCIITLTHNAPDRRVFARLDSCTKSGDATVETATPKENFTIRDRNITDSGPCQ